MSKRPINRAILAKAHPRLFLACDSGGRSHQTARAQDANNLLCRCRPSGRARNHGGCAEIIKRPETARLRNRSEFLRLSRSGYKIPSANFVVISKNSVCRVPRGYHRSGKVATQCSATDQRKYGVFPPPRADCAGGGFPSSRVKAREPVVALIDANWPKVFRRARAPGWENRMIAGY